MGWQICLIVMGGLLSFVLTISVLRWRELRRQRERMTARLVSTSATTMSRPPFVYVNPVSLTSRDQTVGFHSEATHLPAYDPPPSYFATQQAKN